MPSHQRCRGTISPRGRNEAGRPCLRWATRGDYCYGHDPEVIAGRENRAEVDRLDRQRRKGLLERKLALLPCLDLAEKARRKIKNRQERVGASVIIDLLREMIRET